MTVIRSRDNPRVKRWVRLAADSSLRRSEKKALIEGPHVVAEALAAGVEPLALIMSETGLERPELRSLIGKREPVILADRIFGLVADAETAPGIAAEISIPAKAAKAGAAAIFLEGVQDPSNVGAIVRTAAAFGAGEVILDRACAEPWSPKVLRAAMGGHFKLALRQVADLEAELAGFPGTTLCTVANAGVPLRSVELRGRVGWVFGAEGRGVSEAIATRSALKVTIPMSPGTQSLNVAAAAAICLYEAFSRNSG
jgi:TrmH family RNA methyltransferase